MIVEFTQVAQGIGGIATAASVIWAVHTYNRTRETSELFNARHALVSISERINKLDNLR